MGKLYVSDLDGTLLRSNEVTSEYTNQVINSLVSKGMLFSYATSYSSSTLISSVRLSLSTSAQFWSAEVSELS